MLPSFLIIGSPKSGTTSLYRYLQSHPEVYLPPVKELDFFVERLNWSRGIDWYESQFTGAHGASAVGEASVRYSMHPHHAGVAGRVAGSLPDARLVYVVRDPIARMISHYEHAARRGAGRRPLAQALLEDPVYLDTSRYYMQIEQYLHHFSKDQLLVIQSEALAVDRRAQVARVLRFLGVESAVEGLDLGSEHNVTQRKPTPRRQVARAMQHPLWSPLVHPMPDWMKRVAKLATHRPSRRGSLPDSCVAELRARLREDVAQLRAFLGDDLSGWGSA